jgi:biopolymer transport protein ExbD
MKIRGAKQVHYDSGPNMTPLVDVVMVILIFLMLAGTFGANEHYLTSKSVSQGGGKQSEPPPGTVPDEIFEIKITPDSTYGFKVVADDINSQGRVPDRDWLAFEFGRKKKKYDTANTPVEQIQVVLSPSIATRYDHIATVYEAALKAQFTKVGFRTAAK